MNNKLDEIARGLVKAVLGRVKEDKSDLVKADDMPVETSKENGKYTVGEGQFYLDGTMYEIKKANV